MQRRHATRKARWGRSLMGRDSWFGIIGLSPGIGLADDPCDPQPLDLEGGATHFEGVKTSSIGPQPQARQSKPLRESSAV